MTLLSAHPPRTQAPAGLASSPLPAAGGENSLPPYRRDGNKIEAEVGLEARRPRPPTHKHAVHTPLDSSLCLLSDLSPRCFHRADCTPHSPAELVRVQKLSSSAVESLPADAVEAHTADQAKNAATPADMKVMPSRTTPPMYLPALP